MKITFIGMSGSGKTHWSKAFKNKGFTVYCCDDLIEEKLHPELQKLGYRGIQDVAKWMGQPYEPQFKINQNKYLQFEIEVMEALIETLKQSAPEEKIVIDTTGSAIYTGERIVKALKALKALSRIVYFDTPEHVKEAMFKQYMEDPKPVVWGDLFSIEQSETEHEALKRAYPLLLNHRQKQYETWAHHTIPYETRRSESFSIDDLLKEIE